MQERLFSSCANMDKLNNSDIPVVCFHKFPLNLGVCLLACFNSHKPADVCMCRHRIQNTFDLHCRILVDHSQKKQCFQNTFELHYQLLVN